MDKFEKYLNEAKIPKNLSLIKDIVNNAEKAWKNGNDDAFDKFMQAIYNANDTVKMSKYIEQAKKALK